MAATNPLPPVTRALAGTKMNGTIAEGSRQEKIDGDAVFDSSNEAETNLVSSLLWV